MSMISGCFYLSENRKTRETRRFDSQIFLTSFKKFFLYISGTYRLKWLLYILRIGTDVPLYRKSAKKGFKSNLDLSSKVISS